MQEREEKTNPQPLIANPFEDLNDSTLLALCVYGEARNQGLDGMLAVGSVILNRVRAATWMGKNVREVILKPMQFSCFNENDPNRETLEKIAADFHISTYQDADLRAAYWIAVGILDGHLRSNVGGATNYFRRLIGHPDPEWASKMKFVKKVGDHFFYV